MRSTAPAQRRTAHDRPTGATALGRDRAGRPVRHRRHVAGDALRAVRVFAESAFSVVVLGDYDGRPHDTPPPDETDETRRTDGRTAADRD